MSLTTDSPEPSASGFLAVMPPRPGGLTLPCASLSDLLETLAREAPDILDHGRRTALYASWLGSAVGSSGQEQENLFCASLLHDLGKLALPAALRIKPGALSLDEYVLMQCHPREGAEVLEAVPGLRPAAVLIAHHHERWDGRGYPYGLIGRFIPLGARILSVADTFDALTSDRPYSRARSIEEALRLLQLVAGSQLDPDLVERFVALKPRPIMVKPAGFARAAHSDRLGRGVPPAHRPAASGLPAQADREP